MIEVAFGRNWDRLQKRLEEVTVGRVAWEFGRAYAAITEGPAFSLRRALNAEPFAPVNSPFTLTFKRAGLGPLRQTGSLLQSSNFTTFSTDFGMGILWGLSHNLPLPATSVTSRFKRLTDLVAWIHGGPNLSNPAPQYERQLSSKTIRLFRMLYGATSPRFSSAKRARVRAAIEAKSPRGRQLLEQARGNEIRPFHRPSILIRPRPFFKRIYRDTRGRAVVRMREAMERALGFRTTGPL